MSLFPTNVLLATDGSDREAYCPVRVVHGDYEM